MAFESLENLLEQTYTQDIVEKLTQPVSNINAFTKGDRGEIVYHQNLSFEGGGMDFSIGYYYTPLVTASNGTLLVGRIRLRADYDTLSKIEPRGELEIIPLKKTKDGYRVANVIYDYNVLRQVT